MQDDLFEEEHWIQLTSPKSHKNSTVQNVTNADADSSQTLQTKTNPRRYKLKAIRVLSFFFFFFPTEQKYSLTFDLLLHCSAET